MSLLYVKKYMDPELDPDGQKLPDRRILIWGGGAITSGSADPDWRIWIGGSGLADPDWRIRIGGSGLADLDWRIRIRNGGSGSGLVDPDPDWWIRHQKTAI
jgi:hypothetical protein